MTKSLNSVDSKIARRRRRGESEEDYLKRIRRLDAKRESRLRRKGSEIDPETSQPTAAPSNAPREVLQKFLDERDREREESAAQIALLVKRLEHSEFERRRLEAELMRSTSALSTRKHVEPGITATGRPFSVESVEIIDLSGDTSPKNSFCEIIQDFGDTDHGHSTVSPNDPKASKQQQLFSELTPPVGDPIFITPSGYKDGAGRRWDLSSSAGEAEQTKTETTPEKKPPVTLAEAAEMLLWVGWVDRARQEHPRDFLVARFGPQERRAWSDVVAVAAEFVGCHDVSVASDSIPFAFELAWTLRFALDSLPPGAPIAEVAWRCATSFMRPQPRNRLGVLGGCETVDAVVSKYAAVQSEISSGRLAILRAEAV